MLRVVFGGPSYSSALPPNFTGSELVWIIGSKWQILNSQLLKQRRNLLEGWGYDEMKLERDTSCTWAGEPWHEDASPRGSSRFSPKPPAHSFCLRQSLQPLVTKNIPKNSDWPSCHEVRVDQMTS